MKHYLPTTDRAAAAAAGTIQRYSLMSGVAEPQLCMFMFMNTPARHCSLNFPAASAGLGAVPRKIAKCAGFGSHFPYAALFTAAELHSLSFLSLYAASVVRLCIHV